MLRFRDKNFSWEKFDEENYKWLHPSRKDRILQWFYIWYCYFKKVIFWKTIVPMLQNIGGTICQILNKRS